MMMTMMMMMMKMKMMMKEINTQRKETKETRNSQRGTMMMMMMRDITPRMRITITKRTNQTKGSMKESITKGNMRKGKFSLIF